MPPARDHVPSLCARYSHLSPVVTQENADTDHTRTGEPPKLAEHRPAYLQPQRSAELLIRPGLAGSCLAASLPFAPPFLVIPERRSSADHLPESARPSLHALLVLVRRLSTRPPPCAQSVAP